MITQKETDNRIPSSLPSPTSDGTNARCGLWAYADVGDDCGTLTDQYGISLSDFRGLNPEVGENCTNLNLKHYYCVELSRYSGYEGSRIRRPFVKRPSRMPLPDPIIGDWLANFTTARPVRPVIPVAEGHAAGEVEGCTRWSAPKSHATCKGLLIQWGLDMSTFYEWNPSVGEDCNNMSVGTWYCVSIDEHGLPPELVDTPTTTAATSSTSNTGPSSVSTVTTGVSTPSLIQTDMVGEL
ncbi:Uu.00g103250.m01.CDS01 [Anthostomella pinea]|uniref:Uu.00g103250.m01.CDS01 n=1 Tax=Anthostomella pinea TaxID=933095 RepID=A0AAI8VEI9_9PEZI|nr:Uu.00g103250.m01.CDS01 [Anthostomella pinea]